MREEYRMGDAIKQAKERIRNLRYSIRVFESRKRARLSNTEVEH
jgi:hypothetical protein